MGLRSASSAMINSLFSLVIERVDTQTEHYVVFLLTSQYPHFHSVSSDQLHGNFSLMFVFCWHDWIKILGGWIRQVLEAISLRLTHNQISLFLGNWRGRYLNWALYSIFINITISSISFSVQWSTAREDTPGRSINPTVCELCWPRNLACCCHLGLSNPWFDAV